MGDIVVNILSILYEDFSALSKELFAIYDSDAWKNGEEESQIKVRVISAQMDEIKHVLTRICDLIPS